MRKLVLCLGVIFGVFVALSSVSGVSASTADKLQPASDITYNETVIVPSIKVGAQGVGGVTFFNGTIVNSTTNDGVDNPVTFGDNVRIDGRVHRGENYGPGLDDNRPFIINDDVEITGSLTIVADDSDDSGTTVTVGDITAVTAGSGLSGGGTTGDVTLSVSGVTSAMITDGTITGDDISNSANLSVNAITANSYTYRTVQTRHWSIGGSGFLPLTNLIAYSKNFDYLTNATGSFFAPVHLPDGALVTGMEISYWDNQGAAKANVYLERYQKDGSSANVNMATAHSSGFSGEWETASDTSIDRATIDNNQYVYRIRAVMNNNSIKLSGVELTYTVTNLLP